MALLGTIFYGWVTTGHTFAEPTTRRTRFDAFALCAALSLLLLHTAVAEDTLLGRWGYQGAGAQG